MAGIRKRYSSEIKAKVALEAIRGNKTTNELASEFGVHSNQIAQWKKQALDGLPDLFSTRATGEAKRDDALVANLYQEIGQLKVELDWLKKNQVSSVEQKRALIDAENTQVSVARQCELLNLARSSYTIILLGSMRRIWCSCACLTNNTHAHLFTEHGRWPPS